MKVDFLASEPQYRAHMDPIWLALPDEYKGNFYIGRQTRHNPPTWADVVVVAASGDHNFVSKGRRGPGGNKVVYDSQLNPIVRYTKPNKTFSPKIVRMEHGVGFSFGGDPDPGVSRHPSYAGGKGFFGKTDLFLCTNRWTQERWEQYYPSVPTELIGCPKLDLNIPRKPMDSIPTVVVSFHWDCTLCGETRWVFPHYREAIIELAKRTDIRLLGHSHPRCNIAMKLFFETNGIDFISSFDEVMRLADVYINDSSSTLYEFASLDRPVVILNAPWYRNYIHHGLRFWEYSDIGPAVWEPEHLSSAVSDAIERDEKFRDARREAIVHVFPFKGSSASKAAQAILNLN